MASVHDKRFPGESEEYRRARDQLLADEIELRRQIETVSARRRQLPRGGEVPTDYARLLSSAGNTYNLDYHAEDADENQWPLATVFVRRDGRMHHFWSSELFFAGGKAGQGPRHVDYMWPLYAVLDRTPGGRYDFEPSLEYR